MLRNANMIDEKRDPFTIECLSKNFGLNPANVKKSGFDRLGIMYEIYFNDLKSAQDFYKVMSEAGCYPGLFEFGNFIQLNPAFKDKILNLTGVPNSSSMNKPVQDDIKPKQASGFYHSSHDFAIFPSATQSVSLSAGKEESKSTLELELAKIIPIPFNLDWLSKYLGLNLSHVHKSNFDFTFMEYSITFDTLENAKNFFQTLKKSEASVKIWEFNNTIELPYSDQFKILQHVGQRCAGLNPWNIDFFVKYFDLNREQVKSQEESLSHYTIEFHDSYDAYNYYNKITKNSVYPKNPGSDGKLVFTNLNEINLLKGAAKFVKQSSMNLISAQQKLKH